MSASVPLIGHAGDRVDLLIRQGATYECRVTLTNPEEIPVASEAITITSAAAFNLAHANVAAASLLLRAAAGAPYALGTDYRFNDDLGQITPIAGGALALAAAAPGGVGLIASYGYFEPVNLTGATVRAQMRRKALDVALLATFTVTIVSASGGILTFGLTDEQTAALVAAEELSAVQSRAVWDMELEDALGRVTPVFFGSVTIHREVTR